MSTVQRFKFVGGITVCYHMDQRLFFLYNCTVFYPHSDWSRQRGACINLIRRTCPRHELISLRYDIILFEICEDTYGNLYVSLAVSGREMQTDSGFFPNEFHFLSGVPKILFPENMNTRNNDLVINIPVVGNML